MNYKHEKCIGVGCGSPTPWDPCQGQKIVSSGQPDFEKQKRPGKIEDGPQSVGSEEGGRKVVKEDCGKEVPCLCGRFGSEQKPANTYEIEEKECFYQATHDRGLRITDATFERPIGTKEDSLIEPPENKCPPCSMPEASQ